MQPNPLVHYSGNRIWLDGKWSFPNPYYKAVECLQDTPAELAPIPEPAGEPPKPPRRRVRLIENVPA